MIWYKIERNNSQKFCYFMSVIIIIIGVISITKLPFSRDLRNNLPAIGSEKWFLLLVPTIILAVSVYIYGYILGKQARLFAKWHQYLIDHGCKYNGQVIEIIERRSVNSSNGEDRIAHAFRIRYFSSVENAEKEFITPVLSILVEDSDVTTCDVYEVLETPNWAVSNNNTYNSNSVGYALNPIKLTVTLSKSSNQNWFGNVVADNYKGVKKISRGGSFTDYIIVLLILVLMITVYFVFSR